MGETAGVERRGSWSYSSGCGACKIRECVGCGRSHTIPSRPAAAAVSPGRRPAPAALPARTRTCRRHRWPRAPSWQPHGGQGRRGDDRARGRGGAARRGRWSRRLRSGCRGLWEVLLRGHGRLGSVRQGQLADLGSHKMVGACTCRRRAGGALVSSPPRLFHPHAPAARPSTIEAAASHVGAQKAARSSEQHGTARRELTPHPAGGCVLWLHS